MHSDNKKLVLITGMSRGIGKAIAKELIRGGYLVSGCARNADELESVSREFGSGTVVERVDVSDAPSLERWIARECERPEVVPWGLICAAGIHGAIGPAATAAWEDWKAAVTVNLFGSVAASRAFSQVLVQRKLHGRILFLSGGGATRAIPNLSAYCASKAALVRYAETLAEELSPFGITVNSIAPGGINTALTQTILEAGPERAGTMLFQKTKEQLENGGDSITRPAILCEFLLRPQLSSVTGRLIAAKWDRWEDFENVDWSDPHRYRLRRITKDGGEF